MNYKIDLPIREHEFKCLVTISAESRYDALNILHHLQSTSIAIDIFPGFGMGEANYNREKKDIITKAVADKVMLQMSNYKCVCGHSGTDHCFPDFTINNVFGKCTKCCCQGLAENNLDLQI